MVQRSVHDRMGDIEINLHKLSHIIHCLVPWIPKSASRVGWLKQENIIPYLPLYKDTFSTIVANSADNKFIIFFFFFWGKTGFDMLCCLLNFLPRVLSIKALLSLSYNINKPIKLFVDVSKNCWWNGKQCRTWSDAMYYGIWSGFTLFAKTVVQISRLNTQYKTNTAMAKSKTYH